MSYKTKAQQEESFVKELVEAGGVKSYCVMAEGRNEYYQFELNNGKLRHWTNMSDDNLVKLGLITGE